MNKSKEKNIGFEVLTKNNDQVVYKRVLTDNTSSKVKYKKELGLPKVVMPYFDVTDIENLQKIQDEIAKKVVIRKDGIIEISVRVLKNILTK